MQTSTLTRRVVTNERMATRRVAITGLRFMIYLLVVSFALPEARLSFTGSMLPMIVYPEALQWGKASAPLGLPWLHEIIVIIMGLFFLLAVVSKEITLRFDWRGKFVFLMTILALLALGMPYFLNLQEGSGAFGFQRVFFESLALFLIMSQLSWRPSQLRLLIKLFCGAALFNALVVVAAPLSPEIMGLYVRFIPQKHFSQYLGLFVQPSRLSLFLSMAIVLIYLSMIESVRVSLLKPFLLTVGIMILIAAVLFAQNRTSFFTVPLVLVAATIINRQIIGRKLIIIAFLLMAPLIILLYSGFQEDASQIAGQRFSPQFIETERELARGYIWPKALEVILDNPLGVGFDSFSHAVKEDLYHAHNHYLHWTVMFGWLGLLCFIYLIYRLRLTSLALSANHDFNAVIIMKWAVVLYLLNGLTEPYFITYAGLWFWLFSGAIASCYSDKGVLKLPRTFWV